MFRPNVPHGGFLITVSLAWGLSGCSEPVPLPTNSGDPSVEVPAGDSDPVVGAAAPAPASEPQTASAAPSIPAPAPSSAPETTPRPASGGESGELTVEQYVQRGIPPLDRPWTGDDFNKTSQALRELASQGQLPRLGSGSSGEVFAHMISPRNLEQYENASSPLENRTHSVSHHCQAVSRVLERYREFARNDASLKLELVELLGAQYDAMTVCLKLVDEYEREIPQNHPDFADRQFKAQSPRRAAAAIFSSSLERYLAVDDRDFDHLRAVVAKMKEAFPEIVVRLPGAIVQDALFHLNSRLQSGQFSAIHSDLEELRQGIQAALDARSAR
jgi:hypothetical protein